MDVTVLFDNRLEVFKVAATEKKVKYEQLRAEMADQYSCTAAVVPFIVGALGSWDPENDSFLRILCSRSYATLMWKLCVSDTIAASCDIYIEHLFGVQQAAPLCIIFIYLFMSFLNVLFLFILKMCCP